MFNTKRLEELSHQSITCLLVQHEMLYDHELMVQACVMTGILVQEGHVTAPETPEEIHHGTTVKPTVRRMIYKAIDDDRDRVRFLAAYIVAFETQADVHSRYNRMTAEAITKETTNKTATATPIQELQTA